MRKWALATSVATALCGSANAATYLYALHFDALGSFAATDISFTSNSLTTGNFTYQSGSVNGFAPATVYRGGGSINGVGYLGIETLIDTTAANGTVGGFSISFNPIYPAAVGFYTSSYFGRGVKFSNGVNYQYTSGSLTISELGASSAAPEPASWAMMISGFGLIGAAMRRRKVAVSFTDPCTK